MATLTVVPIQNGSNYGFRMTFAGIVQQSKVKQYAYQVGSDIQNSISSTIDFYGVGGIPPLTCNTTYNCRGAYTKDGTTWIPVTLGVNYTTLPCPTPIYPSPPSWTATSTATTITTYVTFGANTHHVNVYLPGATVPTLTLYSNGNVTHTGLTASTPYTLYIQAWDSTETYGSGSQSYGVTTAGARPSNFSGWGITVAAGQPCTITAAKWNEFTAKVNAFRTYKGLANYGFTTVAPTGTIWYWLANQLVNGIAPMSGAVPSTVSSGDAITAAWLNAVTNALNGIT